MPETHKNPIKFWKGFVSGFMYGGVFGLFIGVILFIAMPPLN